MANKKIEMRPKGTGDYGDVLFPKTSSDMVIDEATNKTVKTLIAETNTTVAGQGARLGTAETNITATTNKTNTHVADSDIHVTATEKALLRSGGGGSVPYGFAVFTGKTISTGNTDTLEIPSGVKTIYVTGVGAGGGGGGSPSFTQPGGGGGTGALCYRVPVGIDSPTDRTAEIIIGAPGKGVHQKQGENGAPSTVKHNGVVVVGLPGGSGGYPGQYGSPGSPGSGAPNYIRDGVSVLTDLAYPVNGENLFLTPGLFVRGVSGAGGRDSIAGIGGNLSDKFLYNFLLFLRSFNIPSFLGILLPTIGSGGMGNVGNGIAGYEGRSGCIIVEWGL